jgi:hypothetical protein
MVSFNSFWQLWLRMATKRRPSFEARGIELFLLIIFDALQAHTVVLEA